MQTKELAKVQKASRITSVSSTDSSLSIGTTLTLEDQLKPKQSKRDPYSVYEAVLKVILLEYKNEPRFKVPTKPPNSQRGSSPSPANVSKTSTTTAPANRDRSPNKHSWFHNKSEADPELLPKDTIPALKKRLGEIAVGKDKSIKDPLSKRCLLHLYNELLDPKSGRIEKAEELTVVFVRLATKEIQLFTGKTDLKSDVYHQTGVFVNILIGILRTQKNSEVSIRKLEDYRNSLKPSTHLRPTDMRGSESALSYLKPSYRLSEISSAQILGSLFAIDDIKLQQDIIRLKDIATEPYLYSDLNKNLSLLKSNEAIFNPDDFDSHDSYFAWKKAEDKELRSLIDSIPLVEAHKVKVNSHDFTFIPVDPRGALIELLSRVLQHERQNSEVTIISNAAKGIVEKCCLYWRVNTTSQACILYQAAHLSILNSNDNELNVETTEYLFGAFSRLLGDSDPHEWSKPDKKLWITSLSNTYIQLMASIRILLTAIYAQKAPKLTPLLRVFYTYIEPDPLYDIILKSGLPQKWLKRLRNTLLSTTEERYIDILKIIPTDSSLGLIHVKEASEGIYKQTQLLQKKFPKPLLDDIFIANEAAYLFIKLFSEDVSNMLAHIEHYSVKSGKSINYADALETYQELKYLREIYSQVSPKNVKFTLDLEKFFFKYLDELCLMSSRKMLPVAQEAIQHDSFEPLDLNAGRGFSSSVLDIFKMINETFAMFRGYGWQNEYHLADIYTKLLKAASDSLVYYSARMMTMIINDLSEEPVSAPSAATREQNRKSGAWIFNEMKAAVSNASSKTETPQPFNFQSRTCVVLNNLSEMLKMLNTLETQIDPESISSKAKNVKSSANKQLQNLFTVRIKNAENIKPCGSDGLSSASVVIIDGHLKKEIGKTKVVPKTLNPVWDEEFEVETTSDNLKVISATVWDHSSKFGSHDLCGRTLLQLDPKKFRNDGIPEEITRDLDIQGTISFEVSLESEKNDAIFSIGRAHRSLTRTMQRAYALIVGKFSKFITYSFSRATLKSICSGNGTRKPTKDESYDAIVPLFDYLNLNLQVLATVLNNDILLKVMIQAWKVVLSSADNLLLPALASVRNTNILTKSNATWQNSLSNAVANVTNTVNIPGFGRALSHNEVDTVFVWLNALCYDFFHNDGAGPPLEKLKNESYQTLLLVPVYYDRDVYFLESEVERLTPIVLRSIREKNFLGDESSSTKTKQRSNTIARSKTVLAYGSAKRREEAKKAIKDSDEDSTHFQISTEDIILRVLLAKDQKEFVTRRLKERERIAKSIATERLARMAVEGRNGH